MAMADGSALMNTYGERRLTLERGAGAWVWDTAGKRYLDALSGIAVCGLGHAHPEVVEAVRQAAGRGLSFGAPTEAESELAELVIARLSSATAGWAGEGGALTPRPRRPAPPSPIEKVRLVSTGTEATMTAIRLVRGATGRDLLIKFAGHYHGHSDGLLAEAGSGVATLGMPGSVGVPEPIAALTLVLPYNDIDAVRAAFAAHAGRIAGIIAEAAGAIAGVLGPDPGFNRQLVELAHAEGALVILDEVLTGFRVGPAGWWGLESDGWAPDLFTFGKVIGGGMPLAALGGRADVMDLLAPLGPVYQAGTLSGNPVAVAAGIATLRLADAGVYSRVDAAAARVSSAVDTALTAAGVPHVVSRAGSLFSTAFRSEPVRDYADARAQEAFRYPPCFHALLDAGVAPPPSVFEAWFLSAAHDDDALSRIEAALPAAAEAAARASERVG
jgi:glutamate-1-semialdehyde 2,1-aminomutase